MGKSKKQNRSKKKPPTSVKDADDTKQTSSVMTLKFRADDEKQASTKADSSQNKSSKAASKPKNAICTNLISCSVFLDKQDTVAEWKANSKLSNDLSDLNHAEKVINLSSALKESSTENELEGKYESGNNLVPNSTDYIVAVNSYNKVGASVQQHSSSHDELWKPKLEEGQPSRPGNVFPLNMVPPDSDSLTKTNKSPQIVSRTRKNHSKTQPRDSSSTNVEKVSATDIDPATNNVSVGPLARDSTDVRTGQGSILKSVTSSKRPARNGSGFNFFNSKFKDITETSVFSTTTAKTVPSDPLGSADNPDIYPGSVKKSNHLPSTKKLSDFMDGNTKEYVEKLICAKTVISGDNVIEAVNETNSTSDNPNESNKQQSSELDHSLPFSDLSYVIQEHKSVRKQSNKRCSRQQRAKRDWNSPPVSSKSDVQFFSVGHGSNFTHKDGESRMKRMKKEGKSSSSKIKNTPKDHCCSTTTLDSSDTLILTRSMIKDSGSSNGLLLPDETSNSRKRHFDGREPWHNLRLEQQACLLWSSEQRRRFQLEHPDAKSEELDDIMRGYWKKMSERECQRYIQRARNAMNDRNGVFRTRNPPRFASMDRDFVKSNQSNPQSNQFVGSSNFLNQLSKAVQTKLKYLQKNLNSFQYQKFVREYYRRLAESQQNLPHDQDDLVEQQQRQPKEDRGNQQKFSENALKVMQKLAQEQEKSLKFCLCERRAVKQRRMLENYEPVMRHLIRGNVDCAPNNDKSDLLTELLRDLEDLGEWKSPDPDTIDTLSDPEKDAQKTVTMSESDLHDCVSSNICDDSLPKVTDAFYHKLLLYEASCQSHLCQLCVEDVEDCLREPCAAYENLTLLLPSDVFLMDAFSRILRYSGGIEPCCELNSPSCILSDLLVASRLQKLENASMFGDCVDQDVDLQATTVEDEQLHAGQRRHQQKCQHGTDSRIGASSAGAEAGRCSSDVTALPGSVRTRSDHCLLQESDLDGIFGVDTWLTAPIIHCPIQQPRNPNSIQQTEVGTDQLCHMVPSSPTMLSAANAINSGYQAAHSGDLGMWAFQEDHEEFNLLGMLQDGVVNGSNVGDSND